MYKLLTLGAVWLTLCTAQAQAFGPSQGPDTPPIRAEFPTRIGGLNTDTLMERSTVSASRRGWTESAMLASIEVIGERLSIDPAPDYMTCAAQSNTRWTCAARTAHNRVTVRVFVPADKRVVITRTFVKAAQGPHVIASAWAAQRGASGCRRTSAPRGYRWGTRRPLTRTQLQQVIVETSRLWDSVDSRYGANGIFTVRPDYNIIRIRGDAATASLRGIVFQATIGRSSGSVCGSVTR